MATSIKRKTASTDFKKVRQRRTFSQEFKQEAVQMLLEGHSAVSVAQRLGLPGPNLLYRWKRDALRQADPAARTLGDRVSQLEEPKKTGKTTFDFRLRFGDSGWSFLGVGACL